MFCAASVSVLRCIHVTFSGILLRNVYLNRWELHLLGVRLEIKFLAFYCFSVISSTGFVLFYILFLPVDRSKTNKYQLML